MPGDFAKFFIDSISYTVDNLDIRLDFDSFDKFKEKISEKLKNMNIDKKRTVIQEFEDGEWHLSATKQEEVLYIDYRYETFLSVLVKNLIENMPGNKITMRMRN
jgi:hypothetical protein